VAGKNTAKIKDIDVTCEITAKEHVEFAARPVLLVTVSKCCLFLQMKHKQASSAED